MTLLFFYILYIYFLIPHFCVVVKIEFIYINKMLPLNKMYNNNLLIKNFIVKNTKKNSSDMRFLCRDYIMIKSGLAGCSFHGLEIKNVISNNNEDNILNFLKNINTSLYEVLYSNRKTKIYLDCEFENVEIDKFNNRFDLYIKFDKIFKKYLIDNKINDFNIVYMDASRKKKDKYKISLHVIVNDTGVFEDRNILKIFIKNLKNLLPNEFIFNDISFVDTKVYNIPQLFKMVLSPSKDDDTLLKPFTISSDNKIEYINIGFISKNFTKFLVGDYTDNNYILDKLFSNLKPIEERKENNNVKKVKEINEKTNEKTNVTNWKIEWIKNNKFVKNIYNIRKINYTENKIDLNRIKPAFCNLCSREHSNENAFCKIDENNIIFYCGRNNKGRVIGSWYNKNNIKMDYVETKSNKVDEDILKELENVKIQNINLINTITKLKEEINKLKELKNIKYNVKNKNTDTLTWDKYYLLGKSFIDGSWNQHINSWKDRNISKLKNRANRIVQYLDLINSKGIENTLSLRKIFHLPNYKFSELLTSLS